MSLFFTWPENKGFPKNRQTNPFTLQTSRAFERIELTVQSLESKSDGCHHRENLRLLKAKFILT